MKNNRIGEQTFLTRVENWETDFNGHWNTRFYSRSFQMAAETVASRKGGENPGVDVIKSRHMRFHHELFPGTPIEVKSAVVAGGPYDGAVVHLLYENSERIAASSLDLPGSGSEWLERVPAERVSYALPRGLHSEAPLPWDVTVPYAETITAEMGTVRPLETDHTGCLTLDAMMERCGHGSHDHVVRMGLSPEYTKKTGVGRMLAEMRTTLLGHCRPGDQLRILSRLTSVDAKFFTTAHYLHTTTGVPIALFELCTLAVDMQARKVTEVPGCLRDKILS